MAENVRGDTRVGRRHTLLRLKKVVTIWQT